MIATAFVLLACGVATPAAAPTTGSNKLAAQRDAEKLLHLFVPPSAARRLTAEPKGDGGVLHAPGSKPGVFDIVDRHSFWHVRSPFDSVVRFIESHPPSGSRRIGGGSTGGPGIPSNRQLIFAFPAISGRISTRWLNVTAVALPRGSTGLRVDAQDVWIVPRSPSEKVPSGVSEIHITSAYRGKPPIMSLNVTDPAKIAQIIRWIDALGTAQPTVIFCPVLGGPTVTFDFRAASGVLLAKASVLDFQGTSGPCNPISFSIRGHRQTPLIGGNFLKRVQRLLGTRFDLARARTHRVAIRPCQPAQLKMSLIRRPGITQDRGLGILLRAASPVACTLRGTPAAKARLTGGRWMRIPRDPNSSYLPPGAGSVTVSNEKAALLQIDIPSECSAGRNQGPPYYVTVLIRIAGVERSINRLKLPARCAKIFISPYYPG